MCDMFDSPRGSFSAGALGLKGVLPKGFNDDDMVECYSILFKRWQNNTRRLYCRAPFPSFSLAFDTHSLSKHQKKDFNYTH